MVNILQGKEITISQKEYEELIRDSETLNILTNYVANVDYVNDSVLKMLLCIEEKKKDKE